MLTHNTSSTNTTHTNPFDQGVDFTPAHPHSMVNPVKQLALKNPQLLNAAHTSPCLNKQPNLSTLMLKAFVEQKLELAKQPSTSNDPRSHALDVLRQRNFKPLSSSALHIPLTGKALGGSVSYRDVLNTQLAELGERIGILQHAHRTQDAEFTVIALTIEDIHEELATMEPDSEEADPLWGAISENENMLTLIQTRMNAIQTEIQGIGTEFTATLNQLNQLNRMP